MHKYAYICIAYFIYINMPEFPSIIKLIIKLTLNLTGLIFWQAEKSNLGTILTYKMLQSAKI